LATRGCSRISLAERLREEGFVDEIYAYKGGHPSPRAEAIIEAAKRAGEAGLVYRIAAVPGSTTEALSLKQALEEAKEREGALRGFDVVILYLPQYYAKRIEADKESREVAYVRHGDLGEGVAPKLLPRDREEAERLGEIRKKLLSLRDAAKKTLLDALKREAFDMALSALPLSPVLTAALGLLLGPLGPWAELLDRLGDSAKRVAARALLALVQRDGREKVAVAVAKLATAAVEAADYVDDDRFETLIDQIAFEWGIDVEMFRTFVKNLAASAKERVATAQDLKALEEEVRRLVEERVGELERGLEKVRREVEEVKTKAQGDLTGVKVLSLTDVEAGFLYHNFVVRDGAPRVRTRVGKRDEEVELVTGGVFKRFAEEVTRRLEERGLVVLVGPRGVGKSALAAYAAWRMLRSGLADAAVDVSEMSAEKARGGLASKLQNLAYAAKGRLLVIYDPSPLSVYYKPDAARAHEGVEIFVEELLAAEGVMRLAVLTREMYERVKHIVPGDYVLEVALNDVEFLAEVIKRYSRCEDSHGELAEGLVKLIAEYDAYTLVAKYAGLWLREKSCGIEDVKTALEEGKREPKLFFASYLWHVLLGGSGNLARKAAVPLLLHAFFGPVPEGVTYLTKAVEHGVSRLLTPEELKGASLYWLKEDDLKPVARWLSYTHEDLMEEMLQEVAGLHGEERRKPYRDALGDLIKALDEALEAVRNEAGGVLPISKKAPWLALAVFVNRRLVEVFKNKEVKNCWKRAAYLMGHALAGRPRAPEEEYLPAEAAEAMGDALEPCEADRYLLTDGRIPRLTRVVVSLPYLEEVGIKPLPSAFADVYDGAVVEELIERWRRRGGYFPAEAVYALGLAAVAASADVDQERADSALYAASFAVQHVIDYHHILPILLALRPLAEKAPDRYVVTLAAASELPNLPEDAVEFIYKTLEELRGRIGRDSLWPLVEAVRAYSNLLRKHWVYVKNEEEAVKAMCSLYKRIDGIRSAGYDNAGWFSWGVNVLAAAAKARVLSVALERDSLAPYVQKYCGVEDAEAEEVMKRLERAARKLEEAKKEGKLEELLAQSGELKKWIEARSVAGDAAEAIEGLRGWFMYELARYVLDHSADEEIAMDNKLEKAAKYFEEAAEAGKKLEDWENYLAGRSLVLRTRVLGAEDWGRFLEGAARFEDLWRETEERFKLTAGYLTAACVILGEYLASLAASRRGVEAEKLLKEHRPLLNYRPEVSVATRLMLRLLGVGEEVQPVEVINAYTPGLEPELLPALKTAYGLIDKSKAVEECVTLGAACVIAVAAVAGNSEAVKRLKEGLMEWLVERLGGLPSEVRSLLEGVDGRALVEVLAPRTGSARFVFTLLAALEGRAEAVRLHGLWGSMFVEAPLTRRLLRGVYEQCADLRSEGCRLALLKLYYLYF